jgi:thioredoxin reductase (NADPH)
VLDVAQLAVLRSYGDEHAISAGDVLFAEGDASYDLIVVLEGEVEIVANAGQPIETVIATYGPGGFLGEISLLTGQRAFLAAVARTSGRVLRIPVAQVRVVMAQEPPPGGSWRCWRATVWHQRGWIWRARLKPSHCSAS